MRIIMIKGFSKTGKTSIVASLVKELKSRGYSVGTVKDIHYEGFQADRPGTDTFVHARAGAIRVTARGGKETAIICGRQMSIDEILKYYKEDFVILEGDCGVKCPTIITGRTVDDVKQRMCREAIAISGVIAASGKAAGETALGGATSAEAVQMAEAGCCHVVSSSSRKEGTDMEFSEPGGGTDARKLEQGSLLMGLPVINGITEVKQLADLIEQKTETQKQDFDVELSIDGQDIWMVPFVRETLKNVVIGAVKALDGYEEGKEIVIKVK